jgi:hypothetical protein
MGATPMFNVIKNTHPLECTATFQNSWYAWNEVERFEDEQNIDVTKIHIPTGFLHDIIDDNNYNSDNGLNEALFPNRLDSIHGYTISNIYSMMDGSTVTSGQLIEKLKLLLPFGLGNTIANYDSLRAVYRF